MDKIELKTLFDEFKDDLSIDGNDNSFVIRYKEHPLIRFSSKALIELIVQYLPPKVIRQIFEKEKSKLEVKEARKKIKKIDVNADILLREYYQRKQEFFKTKNLSKVTPNDKEYNSFIKAAKIIKDNDSTAKEYMKAQLDGLSFLNSRNGAGFPSPIQLCSSGAEDRLLRYRFKMQNQENEYKKDFKRIPITSYDKETPIKENAKFMDALNAIKDKTANLAKTQFVIDVLEYKRGKGKALPEAYEYLEKLKGSN